ncbi:hypothetical protein LTSEHVI_5708 [Salmonella enterica subsp. enterica serovar Hvittingfoss str. A4-620]|nr:hypothetical protein LTSEHVI_5708 [Salmonella enterica subsp. enterica serovar Hvittingfoss str. A4-620]
MAGDGFAVKPDKWVTKIKDVFIYCFIKNILSFLELIVL